MGVRRSGKSVLARLVLENHDFAYVNFDDERLSWLKTSDLQRLEKAIVAVSPRASFWFLDEIQNVPGWDLRLRPLNGPRGQGEDDDARNAEGSFREEHPGRAAAPAFFGDVPE